MVVSTSTLRFTHYSTITSVWSGLNSPLQTSLTGKSKHESTKLFFIFTPYLHYSNYAVTGQRRRAYGPTPTAFRTVHGVQSLLPASYAAENQGTCAGPRSQHGRCRPAPKVSAGLLFFWLYSLWYQGDPFKKTDSFLALVPFVQWRKGAANKWTSISWYPRVYVQLPDRGISTVRVSQASVNMCTFRAEQ